MACPDWLAGLVASSAAWVPACRSAECGCSRCRAIDSTLACYMRAVRVPVRMSPDVRFGRPAVHGISTEALWEHEQAGESVEEISAEFGLPPESVRWALAYETSARARAA
jgi:uncharacterized protein (DUF433 family)